MLVVKCFLSVEAQSNIMQMSAPEAATAALKKHFVVCQKYFPRLVPAGGKGEKLLQNSSNMQKRSYFPRFYALIGLSNLALARKYARAWTIQKLSFRNF